MVDDPDFERFWDRLRGPKPVRERRVYVQLYSSPTKSTWGEKVVAPVQEGGRVRVVFPPVTPSTIIDSVAIWDYDTLGVGLTSFVIAERVAMLPEYLLVQAGIPLAVEFTLPGEKRD